MKLFKLLNKKYPSVNEKNTIKSLGEFLKSKEISGWMTIKASM